MFHERLNLFLQHSTGCFKDHRRSFVLASCVLVAFLLSFIPHSIFSGYPFSRYTLQLHHCPEILLLSLLIKMAVSKQQLFLQAWEELLSSKKGNNVSLSLQRYQEVLEELKVAKAKKGGTSDAEYRLLQRFEMVTIGDSEFLIRKNKKNNKKDDILYYVANEHLFEKIQTIHLNHGHGGINKMMQHVNEKYYNITTEAVKLFISHCDECEVRRLFYIYELYYIVYFHSIVIHDHSYFICLVV